MFAPPTAKPKAHTTSQAPVGRTLTPGRASLHAPGNVEQTGAPARLGWDFSSIPVFDTEKERPSYFSSPRILVQIQCKARQVDGPRDRAESHVAEPMMRTPGRVSGLVWSGRSSRDPSYPLAVQMF